MRKLFWAVLRSHSQGAQGGILDQLFGKVSYLIGLTALFAVVGYVIYDQLETNLQGELQNVVTASVTKNQATGKFPGGLERSIARSLSDGESTDVTIADYAVSMVNGKELAFTTGTPTIGGIQLDSTKAGILVTALDIVANERHAVLIVESIDDKGDCDTILSTNLPIGNLKGIASIADLTAVVAGDKVTIDDREIGFTDCNSADTTSVTLAFGYSFR